MKLGNCKLCLNEKPLVESHVFPEFFYEPVYDEKHRFISVTTHPRHKPKLLQKGFWEHLLCKDCDGQISRYETYAANILRRCDDYRTRDDTAIVIPNFDYQLFKLFGLSLIWRSHISSNHMFKLVRLGPHAEKMRSMILNENPGGPFEYCFTLLKLEGSQIAASMIHGPTPARFYRHKAYVFPAYGFEWSFIVSSHLDYLTDKYPFMGVVPELVILIDKKPQGILLGDMGVRLSNLIKKARPSI